MMKNKKSFSFSLIIGLLLILLTMVAFLVPNMNQVIETIIYVKMLAVIFSIMICTFAVMYLTNNRGLFLSSGFLGAMILYFALNLGMVLLINSIPLIITFHLSLDIVFLIVIINIIKANSYVHRNKEKEDYSKAKSGSIY